MKKEIKIGFIATVTILAFILGFNFLKGQSVFSTSNDFYAIYSELAGLSRGNPVVLNGFKVGQVNDIEFKEGTYDELIVSFSVISDISLPANTIAVIISSDLLGTKAIELKPGNASASVEDGDTIQSALQPDLLEELSDELVPLRNRVVYSLMSLDSILKNATVLLNDEAVKDLHATFNQLNTSTEVISRLLVSQERHLTRTFENLDNISSALEQNTIAMENILTNLEQVSDSIANSSLKETIANAAATLNQAEILLTQINSGKGTMGQLIYNDTLYNNLEVLSASLDSLVTDLKKNPSRYVQVSVFGGK